MVPRELVLLLMLLLLPPLLCCCCCCSPARVTSGFEAVRPTETAVELDLPLLLWGWCEIQHTAVAPSMVPVARDIRTLVYI